MTTAELESMADRLHGLAIRMLRTVRTEDVASGMSGPRLSALSVVVFRGPILIGELAAAEQVRVAVAGQQQYLEEQHACGPHGRHAAEPGQDLLAQDELDLKQQKSPDADRHGEEERGELARGGIGHAGVSLPEVARPRPRPWSVERAHHGSRRVIAIAGRGGTGLWCVRLQARSAVAASARCSAVSAPRSIQASIGR